MELKEILELEGKQVGRLLSIQVGRPEQQVTERPTDGREQAWLSGIYKHTITGPVRLGDTNLDGDGQADLINHGGQYRAVLMYSAEHYGRWGEELTDAGIHWSAQKLTDSGAHWSAQKLTDSGAHWSAQKLTDSGAHWSAQKLTPSDSPNNELDEKASLSLNAEPTALLRSPFAPGAFGENFTVSGLNEDNMCIGDILRIGDVVVQVSQPRSPCWKLGRRHRMPELPALVERLGWTGWYVRPLVTGTVEPGATVHLLKRLYPEWTIRETHRIRRERAHLRKEAAQLAACEELSPDWRHILSTFD